MRMSTGVVLVRVSFEMHRDGEGGVEVTIGFM